MKKFFFFLFIFFLTFSHSQENKIWHSLSGKYYRPGYWWAIEWNMEKNFPASSQRLEASCDGWKWIYLGEKATTSSLLGYYSIQSSVPLLKADLFFSTQENKSVAKEHLNLHSLKPSDILCGFYGNRLLEKIFPQYFHPPGFQIYTQEIAFLPEEWEALNLFHFLAIGKQEIPEAKRKAICHWVNAGGILWISKEMFLEFENLAAFRKKKIQEIEILETGWGAILLVPSYYENIEKEIFLSSLIKEIIPFLQSKFTPKKDYSQSQNTNFFSHSPLWGNRILLSLWLICSCHTFVFFFTKKFKKTYILLVTILFLSSILYTLLAFIPVSCQQFSVTQIASHESIALEHSYIHYNPLKKTKYFFSPSLPMPVKSLPKESEIVKSDEGWKISLPDTSMIFYTQNIFSFPGFFQANKKGDVLFFLNQSFCELQDIVYIQKGLYQPLEHQDQVCSPYSPVSIWDTSHTPFFYREKRLLPWLSQIFSPCIVARGRIRERKIEPNFAYYQKTDLLCIEILQEK